MQFDDDDGRSEVAERRKERSMNLFWTGLVLKGISYYQTQSEPAFCGLATLSVVINALAIDPGRKWKGPWRWFDDTMLDCCEPLDKIKSQGITFGKVACLARCNGAKVEAFRSDQSNIDDFRNRVISCSSEEDCHVIVSYLRTPLNQVKTVARIVQGDPGKVICMEAERTKPAAVVLGTRGRSLFQSVLQGSVGEYCFHHCKAAPVVIVPGKGCMKKSC